MSDKFRRQYRQLTDAEQEKLIAVKAVAGDLDSLIEDWVPDKRARALAQTKLEEAVMWAVKGITG